jgi:hypothetical protein
MTETSTQWRTVLISSAICLVVGLAGGYWLMPTKTITQTVEKIVEKKVAVSDKTVVTRQIKRPDGTTETVTIKKDVTTKENTVAKETVKKEATVAPKAASAYRPDYSVGAQAQVGLDTLTKPSYNITAGYRLFGNLWSEALVNTGHREAALGVRVEF